MTDFTASKIPYRMISVVVLIAIAGLFMARHAGALGPIKDGKTALEQHDYPKALQLLQPAAEQGNAEAQRIMGDIYLEGLGVTQNDDTAMNWYIKAADQGNIEALLFAGAKDGGYLMKHYTPHFGPEGRNLEDWGTFAVSGSGGHEKHLASMYEKGEEGVDRDYFKAYYWAARAEATRQSGEGEKPKDAMYLQSLASNLTPEQLKTVKRICATWNYWAVPRSLELHQKAYFDLDKELSSALEGRKESQFELGYHSETGEGMKQDYQEAYYWYSFGRDKTPAAYLRKAYMTTLLTPEQIAATDLRVNDWKTAHPDPHENHHPPRRGTREWKEQQEQSNSK